MAKSPIGGASSDEPQVDLWARFERAVDAAVKGGPKHKVSPGLKNGRGDQKSAGARRSGNLTAEFELSSNIAKMALRLMEAACVWGNYPFSRRGFPSYGGGIVPQSGRRVF